MIVSSIYLLLKCGQAIISHIKPWCSANSWTTQKIINFVLFKVSVYIIEAKNLTSANLLTGDSYVVVTLGKEKYKTILKQKAEESCREVEYFIFYFLFYQLECHEYLHRKVMNQNLTFSLQCKEHCSSICMTQ